MENLQFGQENKMAIKAKAVKEKVVEEVVEVEEVFEIEPRVKIVQRDLALTWPSSDLNAENVVIFEDYMSFLLNV